MTTQKQELVKIEEKPMEFVPFGASDKIKLTIAIVQKLIAVKTKSGKTCSESDAMKFMMMCQARRLNPFEGDAFLIGYDGKDGPTFSLITAHQAFLKRAEFNPEYDGMKSGVIIERNGEVMEIEGDFYLAGDKLLGGWAIVFFKNRKQPMVKRVRLARFKKPFGIWLDDDAGMICKCAEADALRSSFPTMLGGLYLREEVSVEAHAPKITSPLFTPLTDVELKPVEADEPAVKEIADRCAATNITVDELLTFMRSIGIISDDEKTLNDVHKKYPEVLTGTVLNEWDDVVKRIKDERA